MKTEISTIVSLPVNDVMTLAKTFAESGMFTDTKQTAQAFVKIMAGQEIGIPPFAAMTGVHIIQGKPTIGAGLIASRVKGSGKYDYKVVEQNEKLCSIDFYQGKEKLGNSTFTIADAQKAQTKNLDKFPKNMLFARAISNGVKWFCPDVFSGPVYTPEELDFVVDISHTEETIDYAKALASCESEDELKEVFTAMPKNEQIKYKELTKELKAKFADSEAVSE